jgi:hypothetical protein
MPGAKEEKERLRKVKEWARSADEDLRLARHGLALKSACPYRLIAYHAQQCAEKYLKAFLVFEGVDFPYTHNIAAFWSFVPHPQVGFPLLKMPRRSRLMPSQPAIPVKVRG